MIKWTLPLPPQHCMNLVNDHVNNNKVDPNSWTKIEIKISRETLILVIEKDHTTTNFNSENN